MNPSDWVTSYLLRASNRAGEFYTADLVQTLNDDGYALARQEIETWPLYKQTPLYSLRGLATELGVAEIGYKDEGERCGLGSFKALGGAYGLLRLLQREVAATNGGAFPTSADLFAQKYRSVTDRVTVCAATDGNHGLSVAWGAKLFGCRAIIYLHATVSARRAQNISAMGAEVRRVPGTYDDAVRCAAKAASANSWYIVSDTSYQGYTEIPRDIMHGYMVIVREALEQMSQSGGPTHVFVQGGVGGFAAAVAAAIRTTMTVEQRPRLIVVEPENAACLLASAEAGKPIRLTGDLQTVMAGLAAGEPSMIAWPHILESTDAFLAIGDGAAEESMRVLALSPYGDPSIVAGESGAAGLAGAIATCGNAALASALEIGPQSRILIFGTEGATDPDSYKCIVGHKPGVRPF